MKAGNYKLENEFEDGFGMGFDFIFLSAMDVWRHLIGFVLTALAYVVIDASLHIQMQVVRVYWLSDVCRFQ